MYDCGTVSTASGLGEVNRSELEGALASLTLTPGLTLGVVEVASSDLELHQHPCNEEHHQRRQDHVREPAQICSSGVAIGQKLNMCTAVLIMINPPLILTLENGGRL